MVGESSCVVNQALTHDRTVLHCLAMRICHIFDRRTHECFMMFLQPTWARTSASSELSVPVCFPGLSIFKLSDARRICAARRPYLVKAPAGN